MIIALDKITFTNDFFSTMLPDGSTIILNKVDETFTASDSVCEVKVINIEVQDYEGNIVTCPCVIGMGNNLIKINTKYTQYEGEVLSPENMVYCTIEVYEQ